jgi:hypothetical protein
VPVLALFLFAIAVKARDMAREPRTGIPILISLLVFLVLTLPLIWYAVQLFGQITGTAPTFGLQGVQAITLTLTQLAGYSWILASVFLLLFITKELIFLHETWFGWTRNGHRCNCRGLLFWSCDFLALFCSLSQCL